MLWQCGICLLTKGRMWDSSTSSILLGWSTCGVVAEVYAISYHGIVIPSILVSLDKPWYAANASTLLTLTWQSCTKRYSTVDSLVLMRSFLSTQHNHTTKFQSIHLRELFYHPLVGHLCKDLKQMKHHISTSVYPLFINGTRVSLVFFPKNPENSNTT